MNGIYNNTGYKNTRNRKRILTLDVDDSVSGDNHLGSGGEFNIDLFEPLIIDKQSEVYLDNFISFNSNIANSPANSAFCLKINEFNINSNVASSTNNNEIFNSIVIPNEHNSVGNNHGVVLHKAKKFNYVCDINPGKLGRISGKITNLAGQPIFHGFSTTTLFTYALTGIDSGNLSRSIQNGETFTTISGDTIGDSTEGVFLATHFTTSTTIHFSTNKKIALPAPSAGDITFNVDMNPLFVSNGAGENPDLILIQHDARFIAEFSINSIE